MKELFLGLALCMQVGYPNSYKTHHHSYEGSCYKCNISGHNHKNDAKACFWKKDEQRLYGESCKECNDDIAKVKCYICRVDYHVPAKTNTFRRVETQTQDFMCLGWIYGDNSIFLVWIKIPK